MYLDAELIATHHPRISDDVGGNVSVGEPSPRLVGNGTILGEQSSDEIFGARNATSSLGSAFSW